MYDDKGKIYFVRLSDFINYRSIKLSSAEIKDILEMHPSILKAAIVPVPHETDIEPPNGIYSKSNRKRGKLQLHDLF